MSDEMSSTVMHSSHPQHALLPTNITEDCSFTEQVATCFFCHGPLKGYSTFICTSDAKTLYVHRLCFGDEDPTCYGCGKSVLGTSTYTCTESNFDCNSFFLHKSCAELPKLVNYHKHNHPLTLVPRHVDSHCNVCGTWGYHFTYTCDNCHFYVCLFCVFIQRVLHHEGHQEHALTLMQREALFKCDACAEEAKDFSYACTTCDFWIHKKCAFCPFVIESPTYHHHTLNLHYSIPDIHRYFDRLCGICNKRVPVLCWLYYCHKCTYFVHITCATSSETALLTSKKIEEDGLGNEPDLVQFPLPNEESLLNLIIVQCDKLQHNFGKLQLNFGKLQLNFKGKGKKSITTSMPNDPRIIEEHWSHKNHPLELLQYTSSENDDDHNDDTGVLICDGCIQPITVSQPSYYACKKCGFFLHTFCATKLAQKLVAGKSPFHPQHTLLLEKREEFYMFVECSGCNCKTNGFYYYCHTCLIAIDIRCVFLPKRIKHKSHKHALVQHPAFFSMCSVSNTYTHGAVYACETCSSFKMSILCAFYPSRMKHRYDDHPLSLREPPFFYEGVFYCEVCEEQVNNQLWLYHCGESCDHSFHHDCLRWHENVKLGTTRKVRINNITHTFRLVLKRSLRKKSTWIQCEHCRNWHQYFLECDGCGISGCCMCYWPMKFDKTSTDSKESCNILFSEF